MRIARHLSHIRPRLSVEALESRALLTVSDLVLFPVNVFASDTAQTIKLATFHNDSGGNYLVAVDWGDINTVEPYNRDQSLATVVSAPAVGGVGLDYTVYATHQVLFTGTYPVTLNIIGGQGQSIYAQTPSVINLALDPQPISGFAGVAFQGVTVTSFGKFTITGNNDPTLDYHAGINWGDGTEDSGAIQEIHNYQLDLDSFIVVADHTYAAPGTYTIFINVYGGGGAFSWTKTTATIAPNLVPLAVTGNAKMALKDVPVASFEAPAGAGELANINWGDGTNSVATIVPLPGPAVAGGMTTYTVEGSHTYATAGNHAVTINVINPNHQSAWLSTFATIAPNITGVSGTPVAGTSGKALTAVPIASFTGLNGLTYVSEINWGDGTTTDAVDTAGTPGKGASSPTPYTINATHTYAKAGKYNLVISILGSDGGMAWASSSAVIV